MGAPRLYATYVELIKGEGDDRRRRQYIIFPPMTQAVTAHGADPVPHFFYYWREQTGPRHRAVWAFKKDLDNEFAAGLKKRVTSMENSGWATSPIVTCEITAAELRTFLREPKTPWPVMQRLAKVARRKHGYTI